MIAAIDPFFFIFMLIALGSAVAEWLKKRRQRSELEEWSQEPDSQPKYHPSSRINGGGS